MAPHGGRLKVIVKSPYSQYSGYGTDGFGLIRALDRWGCDVYPQPTWVDVPIPADLAHLFTKTLVGPFDLLICHWDPEHLEITRGAREMSRVAVAWSMWEFAGSPPGAVQACDAHIKEFPGEMGRPDCPDCKPVRHSGLYPHCSRVEDSYDKEGNSKQDGMASRLRWFDMVLGYDQVSVDALAPYVSPQGHVGVLQGGYDSADWKHIDRDWESGRFQFMMHGALNDRKQPWLTIGAFQQLKFEHPEEFAPARLALHTNSPGTLFPELNKPFENTGIRIYVDVWDAPTLREFYAASHCLVAPSRGEGKNLPALEFMTTGGAVIATNFGGHTGWIGGDWAYPLDYTLGSTFGDQPWAAQDAKVDVQHLADTMWHVFTHRSEAKAKGARAEQLIPQMCDWKVVVERLFQRVRDNVPGPGPQIYDAAMACRVEEEEPSRLLL